MSVLIRETRQVINQAGETVPKKFDLTIKNRDIRRKWNSVYFNELIYLIKGLLYVGRVIGVIREIKILLYIRYRSKIMECVFNLLKQVVFQSFNCGQNFIYTINEFSIRKNYHWIYTSSNAKRRCKSLVTLIYDSIWWEAKPQTGSRSHISFKYDIPRKCVDLPWPRL